MSESYMSCNYKDCMVPLTKVAWITRCSHVFCEEHGEKFFMNNAPKVKCPACNETNNKETDVIKNNLNPSDFLVSCVRPEKAVEYAAHACRLWNYQMQMKRKYNTEMLIQKYERLIFEGTSQLQSENKDLKRYISEIDVRLKVINDELLKTKQKLRKYKAAYDKVSSINKMRFTHKSRQNQSDYFDSE